MYGLALGFPNSYDQFKVFSERWVAYLGHLLCS